MQSTVTGRMGRDLSPMEKNVRGYSILCPRSSLRGVKQTVPKVLALYLPLSSSGCAISLAYWVTELTKKTS